MDAPVEDSQLQQLAAASAQEAVLESSQKAPQEAAETAVQALGAVSGGRG